MTEPHRCHCGCGRPTTKRYSRGHNASRSPVAFVVDPGSGCWNWQRATNRGGYGVTWTGDQTQLAHRRYYELLVGPIPDGLTIDHLCRNRACINPDHMEPVSMRENTLRGVGPAAINATKTHCPRGHPYDEENTYIQARGGRICRACHRIHDHARHRKQQQLDLAIAA